MAPPQSQLFAIEKAISKHRSLSLAASRHYGIRAYACDMARGRLKEDAGALPCMQDLRADSSATNELSSLTHSTQK